MGSRREATSAVTSTLTGLIDDNFNENEENVSGSDVSGSEVSGSDSDASERVTLDGLNMDGIRVDELCDSDDSGRLDSAHGSDSDGQNWPEFNLENDMSNPRLEIGMLFKSKHGLKEAAKQYGVFHHMLVGTSIRLNVVQAAKTYVQTWHTKQTQIQIYSNFVSPVRGPKQWASLSNMLPILPPPLRRPPGRPTKVRRKEPDEPQATEMLSKRGVEMRLKDIKLVSEPSKRLPQVSKRVPQLNKVPQLNYLLPQLIKKLPQDKSSH
ncbi:hypothetical protein PVK06_038995 [Gossypium arboreum]|uniref:Uncharacterized protein n=1 Tax=Gossypium arboreum TaxID=29729 RepID=A0ABR0N1P1_GOSAR|nr:hypothetical protein PVK06_038995 [Gossypium arboreum]